MKRIYILETAPYGDGYRLLILDGHGSYIDIEFMILCKQSKIHLLYLLAYTLHILQPLDLALFSVIKLKYWDQIRELATIDDAAPVKKERFMSLYNLARRYGFTKKVI